MCGYGILDDGKAEASAAEISQEIERGAEVLTQEYTSPPISLLALRKQGIRPLLIMNKADDEGAEDIQHLQDEMAQAIADAVQDVLPALRRAVNIAARIVQQIGGEAEGQSHE